MFVIEEDICLKSNHYAKNLDNLAINFYKKFARCKFTLKDGGFHKEINKVAEVDWESFALSIENTLSEQELSKPEAAELKEAVEFVLNAPPRKQYINTNGNLEFRPSVPDHKSRADLILLYVRRVRNNLFHGAKFNADWFDPNRNEPLIKHSIIILNACFRASQSQVSNRYFA